ncbi:MAG TPA: integrase family protein [Gammaproteobacteria bacterium]|nr:integrase family protein [Gammaproteobacteria bacterium]
MAAINFTKKALDTLPLPEQGKRLEVYDNKIRGLLIRVTSNGTKSFTVYRRVNGKPQWVKLGRYPDMPIEQASRRAQKMLSLMADGIDPVAKSRADKVSQVTLGQVFEAYLKAHELKSGTVKDYQRVMAEAFSDWRDKPIVSITKDMVEKRHQSRGQKSKARANNAMRVLRALFNFAAAKYEDAEGQPLIKENPVKRISSIRAWYRIDRRQTVIKPYQLPAWFAAVMRLAPERPGSNAAVARDYLLWVLFTGMRKEEAARLKWSDINLEDRTFTIKDPKNRDHASLPLPNFLYDLLCKRPANTEYIFPGLDKSGYLGDMHYWIRKVTDQSGVQFTLHDLRRTFITTAESLDISVYALKRLLNHRVSQSDVTGGYIITDVERLRKPMQKINDHLLRLANMHPEVQVIDIRHAK